MQRQEIVICNQECNLIKRVPQQVCRALTDGLVTMRFSPRANPSDMKEYSKKFSADLEAEEPQQTGNGSDPAMQQQPVAQDLRFVVKESVNLGFRMLSEIEKMLNKIRE